MTIFQGGRASAFDGDEGVDVGIPSSYLLQVKGSSKLNCKAIQEELTASSLNTNDCFVLVNPDNVTVWYGKGSTGDEREMAKSIALDKSPEPEIVFEGQEKKQFWEELGGRQPYFDQKMLKQDEEVLPPRLFQLSNASGYITVEEIVEFDQDDLIEEDVMILDASHTIFAWFGALSNKAEQNECVRIAQEYLASCPNERDGDTPIMLIKQGMEPPNFIGHFGAWDEDKWDVEEIYAEAASSMNNNGPVEVTNGFHVGYSNAGSLPYSVLTGEELPDNVDPSKKEEYLSDAEFSQVFGMEKEEFYGLPGWKQTNLKKSRQLF